MTALTIVGTDVHQDAVGRFSLNDLHRAAMANGKATVHHRPGEFLRRKETIALIAAVKKRCADSRIDPVETVRGGVRDQQGTFVSKPLVYAYAMWINPDFHLDVIEAFDSIQGAALNLFKQMQALVAEEVSSQVRASFGSRLMNDRKRDIPGLRDRRERLESEIQPVLSLH